MAEGGTCQEMERNRQTEAHSRSGDSRRTDLSGHGKKPTDRGVLTSWRWQREGGHGKKQSERGALTVCRRQREGLVRTRKEIDRPRRTHILETAEGGTCQGKENRPAEAHSRSVDGRERDLSGHEKKPTDRGALTS